MNKLKNWFINLKILQKETLLIIISSFFMLLVGLTGLYFTQQANERMYKIYNNHLLSIKYTYEIIALMLTNESNILNLTNEENLSQKLEYINEIDKTYSKILLFQEKYKETGLDSYESNLFKKYLEKFKTYTEIRIKVIDLVLEEKPQEARDYFISQKPVLNEATNTLATLTEHNNKNAAVTFHQYRRASEFANFIIPALIILSLILSIPLSLLISRLISEPLSKLEKKMKAVSQGNLDIPDEAHSSKDEIGSLEASFTKMKGNIKESRNREQLLRKIIETIRSSLDINETLNNISKEVAELFNAERVLLVEFPDMQNLKEWYIRLDYLNSPKMPRVKDVKLDLDAGEYWGNFIFNQGKPLAIEDVNETKISDSLRYNIEVLGITAITGIAIKKGVFV